MNDVIISKRKAISNWVRQFITVVDLNKQMYKLQESLFGVLKWGQFKPLPKIDYVLIFRTLFAKCETCAVDDLENSIHSYYQVSLVHHKNRRIAVQETKNKQEAFELANTLAIGLKTHLKDSATDPRKSNWLL